MFVVLRTKCQQGYFCPSGSAVAVFNSLLLVSEGFYFLHLSKNRTPCDFSFNNTCCCLLICFLKLFRVNPASAPVINVFISSEGPNVPQTPQKSFTSHHFRKQTLVHQKVPAGFVSVVMCSAPRWPSETWMYICSVRWVSGVVWFCGITLVLFTTDQKKTVYKGYIDILKLLMFLQRYSSCFFVQSVFLHRYFLCILERVTWI